MLQCVCVCGGGSYIMIYGLEGGGGRVQSVPKKLPKFFNGPYQCVGSISFQTKQSFSLSCLGQVSSLKWRPALAQLTLPETQVWPSVWPWTKTPWRNSSGFWNFNFKFFLKLVVAPLYVITLHQVISYNNNGIII
jgi:hypothetical protein